ncbi:MAG: hypothetical protein RLY31_1218 [Bacteroidota bacterium]
MKRPRSNILTALFTWWPIWACLLCVAGAATAQDDHPFAARFTAEHLESAPARLIPFPKTWSRTGDWVPVPALLPAGTDDWPGHLRTALVDLAAATGLPIRRTNCVPLRHVTTDSLPPEAYRLSVSHTGILLESADQAGHFYALQTLRQLLRTSDGVQELPVGVIRDEPAFPLRGFMLDVGRNYQPMASLKHLLDVMARYKLNTFHWHLTDRPAWRIESKAFPELTQAEHHRPTRDPGRYYSYAEIRELIAYARDRHITVLPEIDMPGHSDSFVKAMGATMDSEKGMDILETVLTEFFSEIPRSDCPTIHLGSDEVRIADPAGFIARMTDICRRNGREVVIWNPGLPADTGVIRQTWQARHLEQGPYREIDSWNSYVNNGEPMTQLLRLFFKPIGFSSANRVIGGILCLWPDVNLDAPADAFRINPVFPSLLAYAWKTWTDDVTSAPTSFLTTLPPRNTEAARYFAAFEQYLCHHRDHDLSGLPFAYRRQSDKEWLLAGPFQGADGDSLRLWDAADAFPELPTGIRWQPAGGNTLVIRDRFRLGGYFPEGGAGQTVYALTHVFSDRDRSVDTWVGFETPLRANRTYTGMPGQGSWDPNGGAVWVNGSPLPPPVWQFPDWKPSKTDGWGSPADQEIPWRDEELYWTRTPVKVPLRKGWNRVVARIPCSSDYQNWMFTFVPLETEGLEFVATPSAHSTYYHQRATHFRSLPTQKGGIVFIGDSITDGCEWAELLGDARGIRNRGISGDVVQGVRDRLDEVVRSQPGKIFILIGINDLARGRSAAYVAANTRLLVEELSAACPYTHIYLQSLLPVNPAFRRFQGHMQHKDAIRHVNAALRDLAGGQVHYLDLFSPFADANGHLDARFTNDGLHLNGEGYRHWVDQLREWIR